MHVERGEDPRALHRDARVAMRLPEDELGTRDELVSQLVKSHGHLPVDLRGD